MVNNMRSINNFIKVAMLLVSVVASQSNASTVSTQPNNQKVVQIAVTNIPKSFLPYASIALPEQYSHLFFDPLVRWGQDGQIENRLLAKLKIQSDNKIRFYLKNNIYFHSGNLMTSKDVIWSLNEALKTGYLEKKIEKSIKIQRINNAQFYIESQLSQAQLLDYLTHVFILDSAFY